MSDITDADDEIKAIAWNDLVKAKTVELELRTEVKSLTETQIKFGTLQHELMTEIERLRGIVARQRRELRRLNKYLGPYWAGFRKGLELEGECRLRGIMIEAFGHERVRAAEVAAVAQRSE